MTKDPKELKNTPERHFNEYARNIIDEYNGNVLPRIDIHVIQFQWGNIQIDQCHVEILKKSYRQAEASLSGI